MKDHAREKDTAAWLAQEYGSSNSLFVVRAGSPEETQLPDVYKRQFVLPVRDQRQWFPGGDPPPDGAAE